MRYMTESELYHHGILGQKWGIRRFQNQDGSYTAAGKERYNIEDGKRRSLKSYALEYKDRRENKNRYSRMKKNQNMDTMSMDELKRLQEREAIKGQIKWQQQKNDPNSWKKEFRRELLQSTTKSLLNSAGQEIGKQIINAPVRLAAFAGDKTLSLAGWSARKVVDVATDSRSQEAFSKSIKYLNSPGYRKYTRASVDSNKINQFGDYNSWKKWHSFPENEVLDYDDSYRY